MSAIAFLEPSWPVLGCCFFPIIMAMFGFWVWMLIDAATKCPKQDNTQLVWIIIIIFVGPLGALIYLIVQRPKNPKTSGPPPPPPSPPQA
jgi:hypothetical protein